MKKILLLLICLSLFLTGCSNTTITEANNILSALYDDYCKVQEILFWANLDDEKLLEENGQTFYALSKEYECETVSQLEELLKKVYTEQKVQQLLETYVGNEDKIFREVNGKLGRVYADAPLTNFQLPVEEAHKVNDNEIIVKTIETNMLYPIEIRLLRENSEWKISEINEN